MLNNTLRRFITATFRQDCSILNYANLICKKYIFKRSCRPMACNARIAGKLQYYISDTIQFKLANNEKTVR